MRPILFTVALLIAAHAHAAAKESDFYKIHTFNIPETITLECGALEFMPDGRLAVSTRHGDVYLVNNLYDEPPKSAQFVKWASGLHEVLGLAFNAKDGFLYAVQRGEITKLKDTNGDDVADVYETFCDDWAVTGDYHEYALGSKFDREGNLYVALTLTGSFTSDVPFRGWCLKITPDGKAHPFASGFRSPGGIGLDPQGELYFCENQGPWNGSGALRHVSYRSFQGHPIGNRWYEDPRAKEMGEKPVEPNTNSRIYIEAQRVKQLEPPAVILPHERMGNSSSGFVFENSGGKFGPFAGHALVGDQHHSNLTRVALEKVNGRYQGVAIPFVSGFGSGIVPVIQSPKDGSLFVGGTNRGWGSIGPKPFALERLSWTGKTPFELYDMKIAPDGFTLRFTEAVDPKSAGDVASYKMSTFAYIYRSDYGSPEVDQTTPTVKSAIVAADGKSVKLVVDGMKIGSVHELHLDGVKSPAGEGLLHPVAYYTIWNMPK